MDEEGIAIDIAEASGKATASLCLHAALVGSLVRKGLLSMEDAAELTGVSNEMLRGFDGLSDGARTLAEASLRGFAQAWTKHVTRN